MNEPTQKITISDADRVYIPLSFLALAFLFLMVYQSRQLHREEAQISRVKAQQEKLLEQGKKVQVQLDALAVGTLNLAQGGNANAQFIIEELERNGVSIRPPQAEEGAGQEAEKAAE